MALEPITRQEKIIAGQDLTPITRMEKFLKNFGGSGGGGGAQPDLSQTDTTKPDYVKGVIRQESLPDGYPYKAIEKTALVENMSVTPGYHNPSEYEVNFAFAKGQTYAVEWNGETYECVAFFMEGINAIGNLVLIGIGDDTGEPFIMYANNGILYIKGDDSSTAVTMSIYGQSETIHPIAEEFLPALTSPNGTKYQLTVADDGTLSAVQV